MRDNGFFYKFTQSPSPPRQVLFRGFSNSLCICLPPTIRYSVSLLQSTYVGPVASLITHGFDIGLHHVGPSRDKILRRKVHSPTISAVLSFELCINCSSWDTTYVFFHTYRPVLLHQQHRWVRQGTMHLCLDTQRHSDYDSHFHSRALHSKSILHHHSLGLTHQTTLRKKSELPV